VPRFHFFFPTRFSCLVSSLRQPLDGDTHIMISRSTQGTGYKERGTLHEGKQTTQNRIQDEKLICQVAPSPALGGPHSTLQLKPCLFKICCLRIPVGPGTRDRGDRRQGGISGISGIPNEIPDTRAIWAPTSMSSMSSRVVERDERCSIRHAGDCRYRQ
jgi:hypothetical protein